MLLFSSCGMRAMGGSWPDANDLAAIQVMNELLNPPPFYWPTMENPAGVTCYQGAMGTTCN